jgi:hypothetical protein
MWTMIAQSPWPAQGDERIKADMNTTETSTNVHKTYKTKNIK